MRNKSIKVNINIILVGMIVTFALIIMGFNYNNSLKSSYELSDKIIEQTTTNIINQTITYLHKTDTSLKILSNINQTNNIFDKRDISSDIMWKLLLSEKHIASIFLADDFKNFLQVRREPRFAIREIRDINGKRIDTYEYKDENKNTIEYSKKTASYDPTSRTWFKTTNKKEIYISQPYIFASTNKTGITISYANIDKHGLKLLVGAIDITLDSLTEFLKEQAESISAKIYLIDNNSNFITSSDAQLNKSFLKKAEKNKQENIFYKLQNEIAKKRFEGNIDKYIYKTTKLSIDKNKQWSVIVAVPEDLILGRTKQMLLITILVSLLFVFIFILIATKFSNLISKPIRKLSQDIEDLKNLKTDISIKKDSSITEIATAQQSLISLQKGLNSFKKYMPSDLVKFLIDTNQEAKIGGSEKHLAVMFTDIAGFTTISEKLNPRELTEQLSIYFDRLEAVISKNLGTIDKYIGDAIMAFWGAPIRINDPLGKAVQCALDMQEELSKLNAMWKEQGKAELHTRIGVHYGPTIVGNIGSNNRMNYTIMGDTVNVASRLEGINKNYGTKIMVSQEVYEILNDRFELKYIDEMKLKGKTNATKIYEVKSSK